MLRDETLGRFARAFGRHTGRTAQSGADWAWEILREFMSVDELQHVSGRIEALLNDNPDDLGLLQAFREVGGELEGVTISPAYLRRMLHDTLELIPAVLSLPIAPWMNDPHWTLEPRPTLDWEKSSQN